MGGVDSSGGGEEVKLVNLLFMKDTGLTTVKSPIYSQNKHIRGWGSVTFFKILCQCASTLIWKDHLLGR